VLSTDVEVPIEHLSSGIAPSFSGADAGTSPMFNVRSGCNIRHFRV
jgi:hypothetical protein